jgi:hypothetical protein
VRWPRYIIWGESGSYSDDAAQAVKHVALIAAVEELLDLVAVKRPGGALCTPGGRGGIEGELSGFGGKSVHHFRRKRALLGAWSMEHTALEETGYPGNRFHYVCGITARRF